MLTDKALNFGTTENGRDWCLKALHPSDPITEVRGIPDHSAIPTMLMNYQSTYNVSPTPNSVGTWTMDGQLIPNPLSFGCAISVDSVLTRQTEFVNNQITGANHLARLQTFLSSFNRWRLAYAAVTIYQDGPDLANQGTVLICQKPVTPAQYYMNDYDYPQGSRGRNAAFALQPSDLVDSTTSQAMPNAYFGKSREGAYIPLKLTHSHQAWHSKADLIYQANTSTLVAYNTAGRGGQVILANTTNATTTGIYPFTSMNDCHVCTTGVSGITGDLTSAFCNDNWADFSFRNMAVTTSLSFFFRFGFEVQVLPTSVLAPHLRLSPHYDPVAIDTYFSVARELKDAYPADYNDLGKLWDVISGVAKVAAPFVAAIPGFGLPLSAALVAGSALGDYARNALKRTAAPTRGNVASQSDVENSRLAIKQQAFQSPPRSMTPALPSRRKSRSKQREPQQRRRRRSASN